MGNVVQNVTTTTREAELQERNGQEHQRVYDPVNNAVLQDLLQEIKDLHHTIKVIHNLEI